MSRRRKRKKKAIFGGVLKYEIYGIVLITLAVIALSGEAAVGRSLSKMFGLVLGKFYFVIPLIGIYYGLMVMIHRKWPNQWNSRKTGLLLLVFAFTLMSSISSMEQRLGPINALQPGGVMSQIHIDMREQLLSPDQQGHTSMLNKDISGGYVGALQLTVLLWLFGLTGAKLIMIVMFVICFMLMTQLSYVDLVRIVKTKLLTAGGSVRKKWTGKATPLSASSKGSGNRKPKSEPIPAYEEDMDDDFDEMQPPARKQPIFFQLFGLKNTDKADKEEQTAHADEDEHDLLYDAGDVQPQWRNGNQGEELSDVIEHAEQEASIPVKRSPIIRDFFEQVKNEEKRSEAELEDSLTGGVRNDSIDEPLDSNFMDADANTNININDSATIHGTSEEAQELAQTIANGLTGEEAEGNNVAIPAPPPPKPYKLPSFRLLAKPQNAGKGMGQKDYMQTARKLEATLESFGVRAKVLEVVRGPAVTRYEIQPDIGVKVSRIVSLTDDIALALAAKDIRMEAPIPGKSAIGIEVPNNEVSIVTMREVMETTVFQESVSNLSIAFGRDIAGQTIVGNLAKMPHLLVAGATGSGKSVCINGIITSILYKAKPDEVKFLMVDPKMVELNVYNGIPHLLAPVVTDPKRASLALKKIVVEMEKRYELFSKSGTRNIEGYNNLMKDNPDAFLPYIVVIVDELADLMMVAAGDVEDAIARLAQMARAAGIHLIIATQRPSVDVITGVIKANIPSRIAFGVSSQVDSRTILDMGGAEKLLGRGDMLFMPMGASKPVRVQGAFMSDQEVENIVNYVREQGEAHYDETLVPEVEEVSTDADEMLDELYDQAVNIILEAKQASVSLLQRRMRIGYTRAARLIDSMEARGVIGPYEGSKPREVLISMEQYQQNKVSS
ncbi:FtsK/SpoIIIE family DNA translocase [Paenibacillus polymyxa]|uniref:FtsK/SpoIIIE family DNA translocase n=1 Tax=Paenibacillus polymyxa TaxID=1406 RepID=UPI0025B71499|nr:DNA translocase FtsK [Paenibacillus polymyxa]MDN4083796.1 DNA translocase FtsK [Paenibacillus polymyxa]MDN4087403.1 DNA translocase FtsK [Paenibacillus polymyxa]MDN4109024.1 DNA translocase FtsK [Paenibacillus polymyxa]